MLAWSITFFFVAIVAGVFGFSGIATSAASAGRILFLIFIVLFIVSMIVPRFRGQLIFLVILLTTVPFLAESEKSRVKVNLGDVDFEVKTGDPHPNPDETRVIVERTVVQPRSGCGCSLHSGGPCK